MKAQSLEQQLRNAVPPAPDAEAQMRARRAALAESARVHDQQGAPPRKKESRWPLSWPLKSAWLGGMATACVVVVGVSVVYLMPPKDREIDLNLAMTPNEASRPEGPPAPLQATTQPAEAKADIPSSIAPANPANVVGPASSDVLTNARTQGEREASAQSARTPVAQGAATPTTTDMPAPARMPRSQPSPAFKGSEADLKDADVSEVTVQSSRPTPSPAHNSPSAIVTLESESLEEVRAPKARSKGGFFSRKASVPASPPPAAAPTAEEGRDKFRHFETNPVKRVADDPVSTFSVDVDTAAYSFVRRQLNQGVMPQPDSVRVEEMINYFDYAWPTSDSRDQPFKPTIAVSDSPWGEGKKLVHIGIKGYALPASQQPDVNLVLLLDVSGSMDSPDKLPLAKRSMALLLDSLRPTDTVAIVVYAGRAGRSAKRKRSCARWTRWRPVARPPALPASSSPTPSPKRASARTASIASCSQPMATSMWASRTTRS
jgi:hypothetical protein